jgi:hypothetical protein
MDSKNRLTLLVLLCGAVGGWLLAAPHWVDLASTSAVGGLLIQLGMVFGAALGVRAQFVAVPPPTPPAAPPPTVELKP